MVLLELHAGQIYTIAGVLLSLTKVYILRVKRGSHVMCTHVSHPSHLSALELDLTHFSQREQ